MPITPPNLDDRTFEDLVEEARQRIAQSCPQWTDLSPGDPGVTLLEAFAYLTDILLYRLNRVPEKAYIQFLRLIGVSLQPPTAAAATLEFMLSRTRSGQLDIPRGTRVTTPRSSAGAEPPVFVTIETAVIEPGEALVQVRARHCEIVDAELVGIGNGLPGQTIKVKRPPIIAPTADGLELIVGVQTGEDERIDSEAAVQHDGVTYRIWREVDNFTNLGADRYAYVADRLAGTITFAPAIRMISPEGSLEPVPEALAHVPGPGRQIKVWYHSGGGPEGNVMANLLTTLKDPIAGVEVVNPQPATGGSAAETLANALQRGPQQLHSLHRAITARDFELVAEKSSGAVDRTHAITKAMIWEHAVAGTVEVLLVPHIPTEKRQGGWVTAETLKGYETEKTLELIQQKLDERKPLGTSCSVKWARYKPVKVAVSMTVHSEEDPVAVKERVMKRLWQTITPLSTPPDGKGWPFGKPVTSWDIYKILDEEPGVSSVSQVRLLVDQVPDQEVSAVCTDGYQAHTWYAGAGDKVFRSTNDTQGWEAVGHFPDEKIITVVAFPKLASTQRRAGLVAVATALKEDEGGSALHISKDCGETWEIGLRTTFLVDDMAWLDREMVPVLLLATEKGLYELAVHEEAQPYQVLVVPDQPTLGFYAVAVSTDVWGGTTVAVAAQQNEGVYISYEAGKPETFEAIGLEKELVRGLAFHHYGAHRYLWARTAAIGNDPGNGCFRWLVTGAEENLEGWRHFNAKWDAGGCRGLAFDGPVIYAASLRAGVLKLDTTQTEPAWVSSTIKCNLPLRGTDRLFQPVDAIASDPSGSYLLAAGVDGIYRSADRGESYTHVSSNVFLERVTIPETWLVCSADHDIKVESKDEA